MAGQFLTEATRALFSQFPSQPSASDLFTYFTLSDADLEQVRLHRKERNRIGFSLQLCAVRYLGFVPENLEDSPRSILDYLANQLGINVQAIRHYGKRAQTRSDHLNQALSYLGQRRSDLSDLNALGHWLTARALEHDKPTLLLELACQKLRQDNVLRPGLTSLERLVIHAQVQADEHTFSYLSDLLTTERKALFDALLVVDESRGTTNLTWLRQRSLTNSPRGILETLDKLAQLHKWGYDAWLLVGSVSLTAGATYTLEVSSNTGESSKKVALDGFLILY